MKEKIFNFFKMQKLKIQCLENIVLNELKKEKSKIKKIGLFLLIPFRCIKVLIGKEFIIPYVEVVLTTFCNLKCKGCSALMEYYKKRDNYEVKDIIKSIQRLVDSCDSIKHLRLLGGEPLCYPELYDVIAYLKKQEKINRIAIVTNGTLLIKDDRIIDLLKDDKRFYFSISNYGSVSKNYDDLIKQLEDNNIDYVPMRVNYEWIDYGNFDKRNRKKKDLIKQYCYCTHRVRSLLNGKLFQCYRCSHSTNLKLVPLVEKDYIDLFDDSISIKDLRKRLYKFMYGYIEYIESCDYCDCNKNSKVIDRGFQNKE